MKFEITRCDSPRDSTYKNQGTATRAADLKEGDLSGYVLHHLVVLGLILVSGGRFSARMSSLLVRFVLNQGLYCLVFR